MNKIKRFGTLAIIGLALISQSCADDSFKEIESDLLGNPNYETGVYTATVSISNVREKAIQTNGLGGYLLGQYTQEPFGTKKTSIIAQVTLASVNATFGASSQSSENTNNTQENETVTEAYLYIPFFNSYSSSSAASYVTNTEYTLDSIYGKSSASFKLKINELNYFLRDIDEDLDSQIYYSNLDVSGYLGTLLAEKSDAVISNKSITRYKLDDPRTTENESTTVNDILAPGIRIPLDATFFQTKILDKEGSSELSNATTFKNYFRGISVVADNFSEDLMMLLNMANAKIEIVYTYDVKVDNTTHKVPTRYELNLGGITANLFDNSGENITVDTDTSNVSRVFLSGGQGYTTTFNLFTDAELAEIKAKNVLVSDASLFLYVDQSVTYGKEPDRIYVFNTKTGGILADYQYDPTTRATVAANAMSHHLGKLQKENGKGSYYRIRLTNHVLNVIKNDAENVPIGVVVASNVKNTSAVSYLNSTDEEKYIPMNTVTTPLSTVIYGNSSSVDADKRLVLKINYTKSK